MSEVLDHHDRSNSRDYIARVGRAVIALAAARNPLKLLRAQILLSHEEHFGACMAVAVVMGFAGACLVTFGYLVGRGVI